MVRTKSHLQTPRFGSSRAQSFAFVLERRALDECAQDPPGLVVLGARWLGTGSIRGRGALDVHSSSCDGDDDDCADITGARRYSEPTELNKGTFAHLSSTTEDNI